MRILMLRLLTPVICAIGTLFPAPLIGPASIRAQQPEISEMELMERVAELQRQLQAKQVSERDEAEKALIKLGPTVLDHLEATNNDTPTDAKERLARIRVKLEKLAVAEVTKPSSVNIKGPISLKDALAKINKQTGNKVVIGSDRAGVTDEFLNQQLQLDLKNSEFWPALQQVMEQANLIIEPYGGKPGELHLVPQSAANPGNNQNQPADKTEIPSDFSGIFRLQITRIDSTLNLKNPALDFTNVGLLLRWEPRIKPISIDLPMSSIELIDEFDSPLAVSNPEDVLPGPVQPEIPELEFSIPIKRVDRQIEEIKSLKARLDALLPGRIETFRFRNLEKIKPGTQQRKAGATVTYGGVHKNEDLFGLTIDLSFDENNNALESYQGWVFQNEVFLQDSEGNRHDAIGMETVRQDNSQVSIQYFFVEDPKKYSLIYKTPAAIVKLPVKVELVKIPLP